MSIFEYLFERKNPGKVGTVEKNNQPIKKVSIPVLILKLVITTFMIYGLFYITVLNNLTWINTIIFTVIFLIYCLIGYKVIPHPDTSNVGMLGGLMDHPFRYSDDINRFLILLLVLLYPGRFISTTLIQFIMLFMKKPLNDRRM